jgi:hypothetical protein
MPMRSYTAAELQANADRFPGFQDTASIDHEDPYAFFANSDWNPVLSLSVVAPYINEGGVVSAAILTRGRVQKLN